MKSLPWRRFGNLGLEELLQMKAVFATDHKKRGGGTTSSQRLGGLALVSRGHCLWRNQDSQPGQPERRATSVALCHCPLTWPCRIGDGKKHTILPRPPCLDCFGSGCLYLSRAESPGLCTWPRQRCFNGLKDRRLENRRRGNLVICFPHPPLQNGTLISKLPIKSASRHTGPGPGSSPWRIPSAFLLWCSPSPSTAPSPSPASPRPATLPPLNFILLLTIALLYLAQNSWGGLGSSACNSHFLPHAAALIPWCNHLHITSTGKSSLTRGPVSPLIARAHMCLPLAEGLPLYWYYLFNLTFSSIYP